MKIKKKIVKILALTLSILMLLSVPLSAYASTVPSEVKTPPDYGSGLRSFSRTVNYNDFDFKDVSSRAQWAQDGVRNAVEFGIMKGQTERVFNPGGNMTCAEAITILARIHGIYAYGSLAVAEKEIAKYATTSGHWVNTGGFLPFVKAFGLINTTFDNKLDTAITRAEMAYCWSKSIYRTDESDLMDATWHLRTSWGSWPQTGLSNIVLSLPDVTSSTTHSRYIFGFYEAGITQGSDAIGTYRPRDPITREEAAVILYRLLDTSARFGRQGSGRNATGTQRTFVIADDYKIGNVTFNDDKDWVIVGGEKRIGAAATDRFIEEMLKTSKGVSVNANKTNFTIDLNFPQLPDGYTFVISLEYYGVKNGINTGGDRNSFTQDKKTTGNWTFTIPASHGASGLTIETIMVYVNINTIDKNGTGTENQAIVITYDIKNNRAAVAWADGTATRTDKANWAALLFPQAGK